MVRREALSDRDHRGVSGAKREISVGLHEVGHAVEVGGGQRDEGEDVVPDRAQEPGLSLRAALAFEQVAHLGQDRGGHQQGAWGIIEQGHAAGVMAVLPVGHGHQRPGVPDDHSAGAALGRAAQLRAQNVLRALGEVRASAQRPGPGGAASVATMPSASSHRARAGTGSRCRAAYSTTMEEEYTRPSIVAGSSRAVSPLSP